MNLPTRLIPLPVLFCFLPILQARDLSLEERVRAQEALDRVTYAHQIGATASFESAVPRAAIERKVVASLKLAVALERQWKTVLTPDMLDRELARMAGGSRAPDRLAELFAALGNDGFLVRECLVRPILTERLAREFFEGDAEIHADARRELERLREDLASGRLDPGAEHPGRRVRAAVAWTTAQRGDADAAPEPESHLPIHEEAGSFWLAVPIGPGENGTQEAVYSVPKRRFEEWLASWTPALDERSVRPIAQESSALPLASGEGDAPPGCPFNDLWEDTVLEGGPVARRGTLTAWTGSLLLVWGGEPALYQDLRTGARYDPATNVWTKITALGAPDGYSAATAIWTGQDWIVWGGTGETYYAPPRGTGARYNPLTNEWKAVGTVGAPDGRREHVAVWTGTRMIVWGGAGVAGVLSSGAAYDPAGDSWTPISSLNAPEARTSATAVWTGSEMIVWGGSTVFGRTPTGGRYDPQSDTWTPTGDGAPTGRNSHTAVWTGTRMIVWGGYSSSRVGDGAAYDPATDSWAALPSLNAPEPRMGHSAVWTGGRMIVWGGFGLTSSYLQSGGQYDPVAQAWTATATSGAPAGRNSHGAVWTGSRMIVWGGRLISEDYTDTGGRYDPVSDSWTATSISNGAPARRSGHTAVWTGSRLIIWGGTNPAGVRLSSGGRYDPATDSWSGLSEVSVPAARDNHTAVWTGSRMIVWGGQSGPFAGADGTGGRYDPIADAWTSVSTVQAPAARYDHSAVWSGSRMIVWGGIASGTLLSTGGRYDPATDGWTSLTQTGAPAARRSHTAVWDGSRMIVWGGFSTPASNFLNTGGRYDPAGNSWLSTSLVGAPAARTDHLAVGAGGSMLIWGGQNTGGVLWNGARYNGSSDAWSPMSVVNSGPGGNLIAGTWTGSSLAVWGGQTNSQYGAFYDPASDVWTRIATAGQPGARSGHTVAWTGSHLIVYGGSDTNTGGRHCSCTVSATWYRDADVDGYTVGSGVPGCWPSPPSGYVTSGPPDCDDSDGRLQTTPGEVTGLLFDPDRATLHWSAPAGAVAAVTRYDAARSISPASFVGDYGICMKRNEPDPVLVDAELPEPGVCYFYLASAQNACGDGTWGTDSSGQPREGGNCP